MASATSTKSSSSSVSPSSVITSPAVFVLLLVVLTAEEGVDGHLHLSDLGQETLHLRLVSNCIRLKGRYHVATRGKGGERKIHSGRILGMEGAGAKSPKEDGMSP